MIRRNPYVVMISALLLMAAGCSYPKNFTRDFYNENEKTLVNLKEQYKKLYDEKPFAVLFEDKTFKNIGFEILTDSIKYIYHFNLDEPAFKDTLNQYRFNTAAMTDFISGLQQIKCTWTTILDYYENYEKRFLVLMAVRNSALNKTFKGESYCTLAFFERPQPYDEKGRFLDRADRQRNRKINGYTLNRVNDSLGYAITKHYR